MPLFTDDPKLRVSRQSALQMIGAIGGAVSFINCSGDGSTPATAATATPTAKASSSATASASPTATATSTAGTSSECTTTPEGEIGPYFTDDSATGYNRSNILTNIDGTSSQTGIPFALKVTVVDTEKSCAVVVGSQVDIWHCNAYGIYSNESSESSVGQSWLRGYQLTDSTGTVTFTTIVPGWYQGRTQHIHLRVRSSYSEASSTSDGTNTTQVFFPQDVLDYISTNVAPYSSEGVDTTTNAGDRVYADQTKGQTLLSLAGSYTAGFSASNTIGLPI